jgi:sec-independent protein translocase protein TatA
VFGFGFGELFVILLILVVVFGAGKLGDVGGDIGRAIRNFRKSMNEPDAIDVTPRDELDPLKKKDERVADPATKAQTKN